MTDVPMKTVIALSKRYDDHLAVQLNAIGHLGQAIGVARPDLDTADYRTADDQRLGSLSFWPLIVLAGRPGKVQELWEASRGEPWARACFVETMIAGGSLAQIEATYQLAGDDLPIIALALHGPAAALDAHTRKLSLWKAPVLAA